MRSATSLRHSVEMLFTDAATGRRRFVTVDYHTSGDRAWCEAVFDDGTVDARELRGDGVRWWRERLFPDDPNGGRFARIVTIAGTPLLSPVQETIRRLRARRHPLESLGALGSEAMAAD